ncbi:ferritin-like domain-containing protein [Larkinella rosea]|uniref:Ferritin-like domain-containing protein n=1 Tax=Larkinella rosea TaxID=2025312 RepID=A0A3P1C7S3_9BACT|nr:ferritin-like domain-containing protein [Larkinella rosea]RRB09361.1 ferritin-like domain-containing protein [Larkinella rosea]
MKTMQEFMAHTIQDLYSAETQALEAMSQLVELAQSDQLRQAIQVHQRETEQHVKRLEVIARQMGIEPDGETCLAMEGLIEEAQDLLAQLEEPELADAAIIGAAQKMEHYEIASYGTARTLAQQAGLTQVADLLQTTLKEEKATDEKLTYIATNSVNQKAVQS